jgi:hypothetical protein
MTWLYLVFVQSVFVFVVFTLTTGHFTSGVDADLMSQYGKAEKFSGLTSSDFQNVLWQNATGKNMAVLKVGGCLYEVDLVDP